MKQNIPDLWKDKIPHPKSDGHKYDRGHALIYAAPELTGATRLAATACARAGGGLITVLSPKEAASIYRTALPAHIMVREDLEWMDAHVTARLYGPGGLCKDVDYDSDLPTILDADALKDLPGRLAPNYILTPHDGEFARAFPDLTGSRLERAQDAADMTEAIIVLKGAETVIAHPDGDVIVNNHASPHLASAGTGDVLAGLMTGLCAQGMEPFDAACAAVWIHGEAGIRIGTGLVASDIPDHIPEILRDFT